jgi:SAM-dependent methyltransferase
VSPGDGEPGWPDIAATYAAVADDYAATFDGELADKPFDRALLTDVAAAVGGHGTVADLGCGPGQIGAFLHDQGCPVVGLDLSPALLAHAATRHGMAVVTGDLRRLPLGGGTLAGAVCFYALIHLPRDQVRAALAEAARVLAPGGHLVLAVHAGVGELRHDEFLGHPVAVAATLFGQGELARLVREAGLDVVWVATRDPYPREAPTPRLYLWSRRPPAGG